MPSVEHPRVRPGALEDRLYQANIVATATAHNTLVVLPTGLGKTAIALRVIAEYWLRFPTKSILFLAPTRPLVVQHGESIRASLLAPDPTLLTGAVTPDRRLVLPTEPGIIVATPQVIANDLRSGALDLGRFSLIVVDEAHRAVGDYPYVAIGRANQAGPRARVLALTASPGSNRRRVEELWGNLGIDRFEYRTQDDPDVRPYSHGIGVEMVSVPLPPEVQHLAVRLRAAVQRAADILEHQHLVAPGAANRRVLLAVGDRLHREVAVLRARGEPAPPGLWSAVTAQAVAMKALHALELIESQGVEALREFLERQEPAAGRRQTPAQRTFLRDPDVQEVRLKLNQIDLEHPKVARAVELVQRELAQHPDGRVIVFAQYRQTAELLVTELERLQDPRVRPVRFVGQASRGTDEGLSQKEQVARLEAFRSGGVNCLVATSVGEEGLDIPSTDLVIFYEPVPDVIRTIQRRGRTGRVSAGRVIVLIAEGTRDVGLHYAARSRERRMHDMLDAVEEEFRSGPASPPPHRTVQHSLSEFEASGSG